MTATSCTETAQSQQNEPSLARSSTKGSKRPMSVHSSRSTQAVLWPEDFPPLEKQMDGWPTVAKMMTIKPEFSSLCRFSDLNTKSLLYYQAELVQLRQELHMHEWNDNRTGDEEDMSGPGNYFWSADCLVDSRHRPNSQQWDVIVKIRKVLKEYNDALLQYSQISALPSPDPYNFESFRKWISDPSIRHPEYAKVNGADEVWGDISRVDSEPKSLHWRFILLWWHLVAPTSERKQKEQQDLDLVATKPCKEVDFLTRWIMEEFIPFYNDLKQTSFLAWLKTVRTDMKRLVDFSRKRKPKQESATDAEKASQQSNTTKEGKEGVKIETYSGKRMIRFTSAVATIIACLLPTVAITVLSKISDTGSILGAIAGFTALFAAGLMMLTDAGTSRVEIFTATAAFSAVMVVFVQNGSPVQSS